VSGGVWVWVWVGCYWICFIVGIVVAVLWLFPIVSCYCLYLACGCGSCLVGCLDCGLCFGCASGLGGCNCGGCGVVLLWCFGKLVGVVGFMLVGLGGCVFDLSGEN